MKCSIPRLNLGVLARLPDGSANPEYMRAWSENRREALREYHRQYRKRTGRARGISGKDYREMLRSLLRQRDNGICGICMKPVMEGEESVDHIIAICDGGGNEATNIRLAHLFCNMSKRDGKQGAPSGDNHWKRKGAIQ